MAGNEQFGGPISGGMKDLWTLPIAGLVAGLVGLAFGFPALRLSGLYLALATFAIAVAMPSTVKRFEEFSGGGQGIQLFGSPELTGSITNVNVARPLAHAERLDVLPRLVGRARAVRRRVAHPPRAHGARLPRGPRLRDGGRLLRREPRALQDARVRRSARRTRASRVGSSRSRAPSSTRTRSRSRSRSSCSSASSSAGSAACRGSSSARSSSRSCRCGRRARISVRCCRTGSSRRRRSPAARRSSTASCSSCSCSCCRTASAGSSAASVS